jgi:hypothetical protein
VNIRVLASVALLAASLFAAPAQADEVDPEPPVVVDDALTMWPGQRAQIDVLANDSDPGGEDLALCRVPHSTEPDGASPPVSVRDGSWTGEAVGTMEVSTGLRASATHVVDYYAVRARREPACSKESGGFVSGLA